MALEITITNLSSTYNIELDGEDINLRIFYDRTVARWVMDIENVRLDRRVFGIVMNTGADLLSGAGKLGLQVLTPVSMPEPNLEADIDNFPGNIRLIYMTFEEYDLYRYSGRGVKRVQWFDDRDQTPENIITIVGEGTDTSIDPNLFVKKPDVAVDGNLIQFDLNLNAIDSGTTVADLIALTQEIDVPAIAAAYALILGD